MASRQISKRISRDIRSGQPGTTPTIQIKDSIKVLDILIELLVITAIVLIPVVIFPDDDFVSRVGLSKTIVLRIIASLTAILLVARWSIWSIGGGSNQRLFTVPRTIPELRHLVDKITKSRTGLVWVAITGLIIVTTFSAALSVLPNASIWGKDPGSDGYGLYTQVSFFVLFVAATITARSSSQILRLAIAISASGLFAAFTAIAQEHFNWPVEVVFYFGRSSGHFGNPIALGSFLVVTFPIAIGVLTLQRWPYRVWFVATAVVSLIYLYGLQLTLSRGPYLGGLAVLGTLLLLYWRADGRKRALKLTAPIGLAGLMVVAFSFNGGLIHGFTSTYSEDSLVNEFGESTLEERLTKQETIDTRIDTWRSTVELDLRRPAIADQREMPAVVRHLVGYGPDTFRYVLPLTSTDEMFATLTSEAHNDFLHRLTEGGILGLMAFLSLVGVCLFMLRRAYRRVSIQDRPLVSALTIAVAAALVGRMIEQFTGIARVSDGMTFWILIGLTVSLSSMALRSPVFKSDDNASSSTPISSHQRALMPAVSITVLLILIPLALAGVWYKNISYVVADHQLSEARIEIQRSTAAGLAKYDRAIALAPDVVKYRLEKSDVLMSLAETEPNVVARTALIQESYELDSSAYVINSLDRRVNFKLAASAWALAVAGDSEKALEAVQIYERLHSIAPEYELVESRLASLYDATEALRTQ